MKSKIAKRLIDSLKVGKTDFYVFDTELPGFGLRVRATGRAGHQAHARHDAQKVSRQDIARQHSSLSVTPVAANRALATLKALYSWARRHGYVAEGFNPARGIEKFAEKSRERFLTTDEFARLGDALATVEAGVDPGAIAAIRLLILTGARLREILHARGRMSILIAA